MKMTIGLMLLGLWSGLNAATPLLVEDFSGLPQGVNLTNQTWWGPNWNSGDVVYTRVNLDGPGGVPAITRTQEVFAGRFYGGGLRDLRRPLPAIGGPVDLADVKVSFWLKGTSTASRGAIGFSVIGFDTTVSPAVETGAAYYKVIITPEQWTEITFTMADMEDGIIGHGTAGKPFDFALTNEWQVFIWTRNDFEQGWVIQEDENHKWSFSIAELSIVLESGQEPPTEWAGLPIVDGWVDTGAMLGWINVEQAPWVYAYALGNYIYLPEEFVSAAGGWAYILR